MTKTADGGSVDVFIAGGGVNGCGIARDAAGRGLKVALAEANDLGSGTSSASTKLIHGGLRYLEYFEFRLVKESLKEREVLLRAMPHICWPMRFVLPYRSDMYFQSETAASELLKRTMPWLRVRRPAWRVRLGLFLYDSLGTRSILPGTASINLSKARAGEPLREEYRRAFEYSDCWVQDSRLVILNARDAADRGALIMPRTKVVQAERGPSHWTVGTESQDGRRAEYRARAIVNATGPWAADFLGEVIGVPSAARIRLVRGSHIVTRKLYGHEKCYFFPGEDGRIVFAILYENDFTLIGTTDQDHPSAAERPVCGQQESDYLLACASRYFRRPVSRSDIVWTYSGIRPLHDVGPGAATAASRDYFLDVDRSGAPLLNIFGGKITTFRKLAEAALSKLADHLRPCGRAWTSNAPLPGGDFPVDGAMALAESLRETHPFLSADWAMRLARTYGTDSRRILEGAVAREDLGEQFSAKITERELEWAVRREWARTASGLPPQAGWAGPGHGAAASPAPQWYVPA